MKKRAPRAIAAQPFPSALEGHLLKPDDWAQLPEGERHFRSQLRFQVEHLEQLYLFCRKKWESFHVDRRSAQLDWAQVEASGPDWWSIAAICKDLPAARRNAIYALAGIRLARLGAAAIRESAVNLDPITTDGFDRFVGVSAVVAEALVRGYQFAGALGFRPRRSPPTAAIEANRWMGMTTKKLVEQAWAADLKEHSASTDADRVERVAQKVTATKKSRKGEEQTSITPNHVRDLLGLKKKRTIT